VFAEEPACTIVTEQAVTDVIVHLRAASEVVTAPEHQARARKADVHTAVFPNAGFGVWPECLGRAR